MSTRSIFLTGGAGYVGATLVPRLLMDGYRVTVLDLMIYGEEVLPEHPNLKKIKGDIRDQSLLKQLLQGHDAVIHLACISNSFPKTKTFGLRSRIMSSKLPSLRIIT